MSRGRRKRTKSTEKDKNKNTEFIERLFNKKYYFYKDTTWKLPPLEDLYSTDVFQIEKLQEVKCKLNEVKSKLNDFPIEEWSQHTKWRNPAGDITWNVKTLIGAEFVTQAWCKMYECLGSFDVLPPPDTTNINSLHLCEAPGAFVTALNHYLKLNRPGVTWSWCATTLNPYHEGNPLSNTITDDRFILETLENWEFGADNTGDIFNPWNMKMLKERSVVRGNIDLVTADGSVDCFDDPEHQEENVSALHIAQSIVALKVLKKGGNFILKMFTIFEHSSINLLYLLSICFERLVFYKPATSKCGNSENYVICMNYHYTVDTDDLLTNTYLDRIFDNLQNKSRAMFPLHKLPDEFLFQVEKCSKRFMNFQCDVIEHNIKTFRPEGSNRRHCKKLNRLKNEVWLQYVQRYNLEMIAENKKILSGKQFQSQSKFEHRAHRGSHNERTATKMLDDQELGDFLRYELNALQQKNVKCFLGELCHEYFFKTKDVFNEFESLCVGKPVIKLYSSKFLETQFLRLFHKAIEYQREKTTPPDVDVDAPVVEDTDFFRIESKIKFQMNVRVTVMKFCHIKNYNRFEKDLVTSILKSLKTNHDIHTISLSNLPILTHFLVCFIYFLGNLIFDKIHFLSTSNEIVFVKMTRNRKLVDEAIDKLLDLLGKFDIESTEVSLLGFFPIQKLYDSLFYDRLKFFNKMLCFSYCTEYLN